LPDLSHDKSGRACLPLAGALPRPLRQTRPDFSRPDCREPLAFRLAPPRNRVGRLSTGQSLFRPSGVPAEGAQIAHKTGSTSEAQTSAFPLPPRILGKLDSQRRSRLLSQLHSKGRLRILPFRSLLLSSPRFRRVDMSSNRRSTRKECWLQSRSDGRWISCVQVSALSRRYPSASTTIGTCKRCSLHKNSEAYLPHSSSPNIPRGSGGVKPPAASQRRHPCGARVTLHPSARNP
jgi:hypothetical protein